MIYNWHSKHKENLTPGQRAADKLRKSMGSWPFIFFFLIFLASWTILNSVTWWHHHWDHYPFIILNLILSMLAALQGSIILISAKRQDAIAAAMAEHDYQTDLRSARDIEELLEINKQQFEIIQELHKTLKATEDKTKSHP